MTVCWVSDLPIYFEIVQEAIPFRRKRVGRKKRKYCLVEKDGSILRGKNKLMVSEVMSYNLVAVHARS